MAQQAVPKRQKLILALPKGSSARGIAARSELLERLDAMEEELIELAKSDGNTTVEYDENTSSAEEEVYGFQAQSDEMVEDKEEQQATRLTTSPPTVIKKRKCKSKSNGELLVSSMRHFIS